MKQDEAEKLARKVERAHPNPNNIRFMSVHEIAEVAVVLARYIRSGDHKREIENAAYERAAKKADHLGELCDVDCTRLALTDPETGARECSLEVRSGDCLCTAQREQSNLIAVRIRSLIQPLAQKEDGE